MLKFSYFISRVKEIAVLSIQGVLDQSSAEPIGQALGLLPWEDLKAVVIYMQPNSSLDLEGYRHFVELQGEIRKRNLRLKVCVPDPEIRSLVLKGGLGRREEMEADLVQAIKAAGTE